LNLDTPRLAPMGAIEVAADRWRFAFLGGAFTLDRESTRADAAFRIGSVEVSPGEPLDVRMEYATFEATVGYEVWSRDFKAASRVPDNAKDAGLRLIALGGVRVHDIDLSVASLADATSASTDQTYFEPLIGFRFEAELIKQFIVGAQASFGAWVEADRSIFSTDLDIYFGWRFSRNVGLEIGWRQVIMEASDGKEEDEFEFSGGVAGVFVGIEVRF